MLRPQKGLGFEGNVKIIAFLFFFVGTNVLADQPLARLQSKTSDDSSLNGQRTKGRHAMRHSRKAQSSIHCHQRTKMSFASLC